MEYHKLIYQASVNLSVELLLSSDRLAVERVIAKTFTHYQCDVIVTDRVQTLFTSKLYRMGKLLQSLGRAKVLEKWKETTWTLELRENEIVCHSNRKRKPDHAVIQSTRSKQLRLEQKLEETTRSLKDVTNQLHALEESSKRLSASLRDKGQPSSTSRRKKAWSECSVQ